MLPVEKLNEIRDLSKKMRRSVIDTAFAIGRKKVHFGGTLSSVEIIACLYGGILDVDPKNPTKYPRDIFMISKGHCVLTLYTALAHTGFFAIEDLNTFEANGSDLVSHPVMNVNLGIEFSGGSLGMGLSQSVGVAVGFKRKHLDSHVFVLLGDGECDEGCVWEAAMSAAHFKLDNLILIVDKNNLQLDGKISDVMDLKNLTDKFSSFGFDTYEVDGHNISALHNAFLDAKGNFDEKPKAIVANTIKGKGISFMENKVEWHHSTLSAAQYDLAVSELGVVDVEH